jgi:hypothetical protein
MADDLSNLLWETRLARSSVIVAVRYATQSWRTENISRSFYMNGSAKAE